MKYILRGAVVPALFILFVALMREVASEVLDLDIATPEFKKERILTGARK